MRILIIGLNYAPEEAGNAPYTAGMAEHLAALGHDVTVVTGMPHYPRWQVDRGYRWRLWKREPIRGVDVRRRWHHVPGSQSALQRALYEGSFVLTGASVLALPRPDVVLGIVPSLGGGVLARLAATRYRVPYGIVFQDLVGPASAQSGLAGGHRITRLVSTAEAGAAR